MPLSRSLAVDGVGRIMSVYNCFTLSYTDRASGVGAVCKSGFRYAFQNALDCRVCAVIVEIVKIQSVRLSAVFILIDQLIVIDPHGGSHAFQQFICLLAGCIRQSAVGVLIICQAAYYNGSAAIYIIADYIYKFILEYTGLCLSGIIACIFQRRGDHEKRYILQHLRSYFLARLYDLHLDIVRSSHIDKVGHISGIVSVYIVIVMRSVYQHFCGNGRVGNAQLEHIRKGIFFSSDQGFHFSIDIESACLIRCVRERIRKGASRADHTVITDL